MDLDVSTVMATGGRTRYTSSMTAGPDSNGRVSRPRLGRWGWVHDRPRVVVRGEQASR